MSTIVFTNGMRDGMLARRRHPGAEIVRLGDVTPMASGVKDVVNRLQQGQDVIIPINEDAVMGWRAPEGTEVVVTDAVLNKYGEDSPLVCQAYMRSPEWSMNQMSPGPDFPIVIGDAPEEPETSLDLGSP